MKTLPVYRLAAPPQPGLDQIHTMARGLFGIEDYAFQNTHQRRILRSKDNKVVDIDAERGEIWAADEAELWNPSVTAQLPEAPRAGELAGEFVQKNALLPAEHDDRIAVEPLEVAGSYFATYDRKTGQRSDRLLDQQVRYAVRLVVNDPDRDTPIHAPILSGVGKFNVTLGSAGRVIAFNKAWQPIDAVATQAPFVPREAADQQFARLTEQLKIESVDASLAYTSLRAADNQQYLYPVWAYRAMGNIQGHKFPLRIITVPATEFGPQPQLEQPQPKRTRKKVNRKGGPRRDMLAVDPYEAGTAWIGKLGGLGGSQKNAQGFADGMAAAGWRINFNWGDCNAWETDWHENDDDFVDTADIVFYTGHANGDGWMLVDPGTCATNFMSASEVGAVPESPGDIWGQQDLEWLIVAACGPLEDNRISAGGGDVFTRWDGMFDGLHMLMGYGAVTNDNEEEGKRFVQYARDCQPLYQAWLRTAIEIQPSTNGWAAPYGPTVYAAVMWARKSGQPDPGNDHLWGYGSVAPDPIKPDGFSCIWAPC